MQGVRSVSTVVSTALSSFFRTTPKIKKLLQANKNQIISLVPIFVVYNLDIGTFYNSSVNIFSTKVVHWDFLIDENRKNTLIVRVSSFLHYCKWRLYQ